MTDQTQRDTLGLPLRQIATAGVPVVILYGPPGGGKSTQAARAFHARKPLIIITRPGALWPYETYRRVHPGENLTSLSDLAVIEMPDVRARDSKPVDTMGTFDKITTAFLHGVLSKSNPYGAFIVDEYATLVSRAEQQLLVDPTYVRGKYVDTRAVYRELRAWEARTFARLRAARRAIVLICHERAPQYDDNAGDPKTGIPASPTFGQMISKGGPNIRPQTMIGPLCQEADAVLRLVVEDALDTSSGPRRHFSTQAGPLWEAKFPDFAVKPEAPLDLRGLLASAGYEV